MTVMNLSVLRVCGVVLTSTLVGAPTAERQAPSVDVRERADEGSLPILVQPPAFYVRSYGGKCLAFHPPPHRPIGGVSSLLGGSPVFIDDCNGTAAQQVGVEEIKDRHEVILRAGSGVIGKKVNVGEPPNSEE